MKKNLLKNSQSLS